MFNYVNEDKFFEWYVSVSKREITNKSELLNEVVSQAGSVGERIFTLPGSKTISGNDESYKYKVENIGCCGASTIYIYF